MTLNYKTVEGYQEERPLERDFISSPGNVYLRQNITKVKNRDMEGEETEGEHWKYDEVMLTAEEDQEYLGEVESPGIEMIMQRFEELSLQIDEK